jgi:outer membrane protein OmpU
MKKILLATSMLVGTAGFAAAEVTLSGDARMGIVDDGSDSGTVFSSRARVAFGLAGETDGGLSFGASFRADNASSGADVTNATTGVTTPENGADNGTAGSVFISGAFGKLTMGDVDGAAQQATGHVAGVGYTGNGDLNESTFIGAGMDPTALYEYSAGSFTGYVSISNPASPDDVLAVGAKYATDAFTVGLGFEDNGAGTKHTVLKGSTTFSGVTVQALYGKASGTIEGTQYALSAGYSMDGIGVTAFYTDDEELGGAQAYGLGASYALGGGATLAGGVSQNKSADVTRFDLGVNFSF